MNISEQIQILGRTMPMQMISSRTIHPTPVDQTRMRWPSPAAIAIRAHELHRARSGTSGCDLNDWQQAERELIQKVAGEDGTALTRQ